jgi:hypothetical protein
VEVELEGQWGIRRVLTNISISKILMGRHNTTCKPIAHRTLTPRDMNAGQLFGKKCRILARHQADGFSGAPTRRGSSNVERRPTPEIIA